MKNYVFCCLLVSGWLRNAGTNPYRMDDEGRGPDYVMSLILELEEQGGLIVYTKEDAYKSNLPLFELHLEVQIPRLRGCPRVLVLLEDRHIRPQNYFIVKTNYDEIFTWDAALARKLDAHKYTFPSYFTEPSIGDFDKRKHLLTMVSSNKGQLISTKFDLYSKRREIIDWYDLNASDSFCYYGPGWDLPYHPNGFLAKFAFKLYDRIKYAPRVKRKNWGGIASSKLAVLKNSKFNLCFENYCGANGYITEKIFDAFSTGTVPIYWGAPDVLDHIPEGCFIDYRNYGSVRELHEYITNLKETEYRLMQENIHNFYYNSRSKFSIANFSKLITKQILTSVNLTQKDT